MLNGFDEGQAKRDGHAVAVQCIYMTINKSSKRSVPHYHDYIELLYAISGKISIWIDGRRIIFQKGDLVVINSKEQHDLLSISDKSEYIVVKFVPQLLYTSEQSVFELKYMLPFILSDSDHQRLFSKDEIDSDFVYNMMTEIYDEWNRKEYGYELAMRANILRLFLWILRYWNRQNIDVINKFKLSDELSVAVQTAVEFAHKNYKRLSCDEAAHLCNLSYSYFCRTFKRIMKMSFSDYVNHVRVTASEKLLITTEMSIEEISTEVGFSSASYFIQCFKKIKGISPKQFRLNIYRNIE